MSVVYGTGHQTVFVSRCDTCYRYLSNWAVIVNATEHNKVRKLFTSLM